MKVLMLHNRYRIRGGEGVSTDATVSLLRDAGHTVDLVEEWNDRVGELGMVKTSIRSVWSSEAHRDITSRLANGDYDVMHVQNFFPLHSPSVFHAARAMNVPTVNSLRNFRLLCPQGMLYRDGGVCMDCVGLKAPLPAVRHGCYRDSRAGTAVVAAMAVGHRIGGTWRDAVDVHVTPSQYAAEVHVSGGFDPNHIEIVPNFVHPDPTVGTGEGDFVLFAGRLAPEKGIDVLIKAWRTHLSDIPLRIAGTGILEDDVFSIADDLETVEYVGTLEHPQLTKMMGEATLVVAPTTGIETFGRVAAEAHATGTPVVASNLGGLPEIVVHDETGLLVPPGDVHALAAAVRRLWNDRTSLDAMRTASRARYEAEYSAPKALAAWERIYRLAGERNRARTNGQPIHIEHPEGDHA